MPRLLEEEVTATYSGLRAAIDHGDYLIGPDPRQHYVLVGGIRSTGLTSGMAVAEYVRDQLESVGLNLVAKADVPATSSDAQHRGSLHPPLPGRREDKRRPGLRQDRVLCERVTSRRTTRCVHNLVIPPAVLGGLRRRTRVMNGRCQGFFCGAEVQTMLGEARR